MHTNHCLPHGTDHDVPMYLAHPSRFTVCPCQLEELQARGINFQAAGATASLPYPTRGQVAGLLLDRTVFGGPQHAVCGCGALRPARTSFRFSMWVGGWGIVRCRLKCERVQIISTNAQMLSSQISGREWVSKFLSKCDYIRERADPTTLHKRT